MAGELTPVQILGVHLEPSSGATIVLLGQAGGPNRVLPIFVGPAEAASIAMGLSGTQPPRPLTHDLLIDVIGAFAGELLQVRITELVDSTFHAELELETQFGPATVSSRPSDGIALAVRLGLTVVVNSDVFEQASVEVEHEPESGFDDSEIEQIVGEFRGFLESAEPSDFGEEPTTSDEEE